MSGVRIEFPPGTVNSEQYSVISHQ